MLLIRFCLRQLVMQIKIIKIKILIKDKLKVNLYTWVCLIVTKKKYVIRRRILKITWTNQNNKHYWLLENNMENLYAYQIKL